MASWRDSTSPRAQDEMDGVLDAALDLAEDRLADPVPLLPFAVVVGPDGRYEAHGAVEDDGTTVDLEESLVAGLRADRTDYQAVAVVTDVTLSGLDAVQVTVEHSEPSAPALVLAVPYVRTGADVQFGELRATKGHRRVWL